MGVHILNLLKVEKKENDIFKNSVLDFRLFSVKIKEKVTITDTSIGMQLEEIKKKKTHKH